MRRSLPPADQVRDALERVLSSESFARSARARKLLRYLVEQQLAGNAGRLKGFSIAVDVFGKGDSFDPATDTVVRVQAGRMRELLAQYHAGEGRDAPLRIVVPRGSYVPEYHQAEPAAAGEGQPPPDAPAPGADAASGLTERSRRRNLLVPVAAAVLGIAFIVAAAVYWRGSPVQIQHADTAALEGPSTGVAVAGRTGSAPGELLPAAYMSVQPGNYGGERVASALRRGLAAFDTLHFIARPPAPDGPGLHRETDFVFLLEEGDATGDVHLEVHHVLSGQVLLSRTLVTDGQAQQAIDDEVAMMLTSVVPVSGAIYAALAQRGVRPALIDCLIQNERFYRDQGPLTHRAAYGCLEDLAANELKSGLVYSELAALHLQAVISRYPYPRDASAQEALALARKAVQLAPNSPSAHRAMGYVLARTEAVDEALRWTRRAYELNPFDLGMAASYGYALIFDGSYAQGTQILTRAATAASAHPTWWDYGLFLGHFMLDDMQAAAGAASALATSARAHYIAARLLVADALGRREEADALLARLERSHPTFAADPGAFFRRGNYPADLTERLVEAFQVARLRRGS